MLKPQLKPHSSCQVYVVTGMLANGSAWYGDVLRQHNCQFTSEEIWILQGQIGKRIFDNKPEASELLSQNPAFCAALLIHVYLV